jgi:hypothetical protein
MTDLQKVFENLTKWRAQPGYQLERRVDALLSPYLESFLETLFGNGSKVDLVISELPVPKAILPGKAFRKNGKEERGNVLADFLLFRHGPNPAWVLLEFKTDMGSRTDEEDQSYRALIGKTMPEILAALRKAKKGSRFEADYRRLAWAVRSDLHPKAPVEVHFLQPTRGPKDFGHTHTISEFIQSKVGQGDELWDLLVKLLRGVVRSDKGRGVKGKKTRPKAR